LKYIYDIAVRLFIVISIVIPFIACQDNDGLVKVCPQPVPCGISQAGDIIVSDEYKTFAQYQVGECKLGTLRCDDEGNEYCANFIAPAEEVCDLKDNDCDGDTDEGFDRDYDGVAFCAGDCDDNNSLTYPGARERCNNRDDNCDGLVDEALSKACWSGPPPTVLDQPPSICQSGTSSCTRGQWNPCQGEVLPTVEVCDSLDNDCNGLVDERQYNVCGATDVGQCELGDRVCLSNEQICVEAIYPSGEICDAADNDCDGVVDEGIYQPCSTLCGSGIEICNMGQWIDCTAPEPEIELCDGVDNDCDGDVDEDCACIDGQVATCRNGIIDRATGTVINCGLGITMCDSQGNWGPCYFFSTEPEICNNWDDDCDNQIDGMTQPCGNPNTAGIGVCRLGEQLCTAGQWSTCQGDVVPQSEICDQLDNDCDGLIDEDLNPHAKVDMVFAIDISGSMCSSINALIQGIGTYITEFAGTDHRFSIVTFPGYPVPGSTVQVPGTVRTSPTLLSATAFQNMLGQITCNGGGWEPSYDIAYMLSSSADPLNIGWRSDAYPYIIIISDENAQTWRNLTQTQIAPQMSNCTIGSCVLGDAIEVYIIGPSYAASQWNLITYSDPARFINISPIDANRYTQFFRDIFQNICI
jgi:hypothetical protein